MAFYMIKPRDEYGNRGYKNPRDSILVFEATREPWQNNLEHLVVISPGEDEFPWRGLYPPSDFVEVSGPVRRITEKEYVAELEKAGVTGWRLEAAKRRAGL
jgi:hypothetical protein